MQLTRKLVLLLALAMPFPAQSAPVTYVLDKEATTIAFETNFGTEKIVGTIPPDSADLVLDFERISNCKINVTLDVSRARANFPFAADAMKGPAVLDAANHPQMSFESTRVRQTNEGASVGGTLTIRGISQPMTLQAQLFRPKNSLRGDHSHLTLRLTGRLSRKAFGAAGWSDLVDDEVRIIINARIATKG